MEKITLYDKDNDKMYNIMLSPEDARRAASDVIFATSLLNATILDKNKTEQNEVISKVLDVDNNVQSNIMPKIYDEHNNKSIDSCEENYLFRWSEGCVLLLLRTYEEMEEKFNNGKISHKKCWELIAQILKNEGYDVTGPQCASKFRSLKKTYKSIKDHNSKSGNDRRTWQYLEIMDNMFSKKAWCKPVALASSTGLSIRNIDAEESSTTSSQLSYDSDAGKENDLSRNRKRTQKTSAIELMEKRLTQKEEHERKKQKRHDERIQMETKLIDALTQFLNK